MYNGFFNWNTKKIPWIRKRRMKMMLNTFKSDLERKRCRTWLYIMMIIIIIINNFSNTFIVFFLNYILITQLACLDKKKNNSSMRKILKNVHFTNYRTGLPLCKNACNFHTLTSFTWKNCTNRHSWKFYLLNRGTYAVHVISGILNIKKK